MSLMRGFILLFFKAKIKIIFFLWVLFLSQKIWAAACCGGGASIPSLILGDDRRQVSTQMSFGQTAVEYVDAQGLWYTSDESTATQTLKMDVAQIISDRWQVGVSIPWIQKIKAQEKQSGLGDISFNLGYEYLPDWDYHPWRPKGMGYVQILAPFGKSNEEATDLYKLETRGRGYWQLGMGTVLSKSKGAFDMSFSFEAHYSLKKQIHLEGQDGTAYPGWGGQVGPSLGFNLKNWRFGAAISWIQEDPVEIQDSKGQAYSQSLFQRYANSSFSLTYMFPESQGEIWSSTLTYADQTLFGDPYNTSLERVVSILVQHRWAR